MSTVNQERIRELEEEIRALGERLKEAQDELLMERFADTPAKYKVGDIVLVPRLLFGKHKLWPAKIAAVHRRYNAGTNARGEDYESKTISYSYFLQQKDDSFGGSSNGAYEYEIQPLPEAAAAS